MGIVTNPNLFLICPMPADGDRCGAELYLSWEHAYGLSTTDVTGGDLPAVQDAHSASWRVVCTEGHTLLLPGPVGCPECGDDLGCKHEDFDTSDDDRRFRPHDVQRLEALLERLTAVTETLVEVPGIGPAAAS